MLQEWGARGSKVWYSQYGGTLDVADRSHHFEATVAQTSLLVVLGLTAAGGLIATAAYVWHLYRLLVLNG